jgi:hypothetical protein
VLYSFFPVLFSFFPVLFFFFLSCVIVYTDTHTTLVESRILSRTDHFQAEFCKNSVFSTEFCINTRICIYVFLIETEVFLRILFKIRIMSLLKLSCILSKEYFELKPEVEYSGFEELFKYNYHLLKYFIISVNLIALFYATVFI